MRADGSDDFAALVDRILTRPRICGTCRSEHAPPMCARKCEVCRTADAEALDAPGSYCAPCRAAKQEEQRWPGIIHRHGNFASIVGELYANATAADSGMADLASAFFRKPATGLLIQGPVGTGKTHLAAGIARPWYLSGRTVAFIPSRRLFRAIRDTYSPNSTETEGQIVERYTGTDLLVIDDLGREGRITEQVQSVLHEVLDERIRGKRPTIVTTNIGDEIATVYGDAIGSRISLLTPITVEGADRRQT